MLTPAKIRWTDDGYPYSEGFDDIYFSGNGIEETEHVFLKANHLPERFADARAFTIIETGFGTGLNFLCAWELWQRTALPGAVLHYVAFEKHPLVKNDLERALAQWPEFSFFTKAFIKSYPLIVAGKHSIFLQENLHLTLYYGDILDMLPLCEEKADAWFLDGFAPAKNPEMWNDELYRHIVRLSKKDTTCSSFTAAGHVRRALEASGFTMKKVPGFGRKREMLTGEFR